jgi:HD-like signal output (HDOD) protein
VERAVAYVGLDTLTALVLGHGLFQNIESAGTEILWGHSLKTALAARAIALSENLPNGRVEEAFLAGMLHDVGRVVIAARTGSGGKGQKTLTQAEFAQLDLRPGTGDHHAEAGAYLLGIWGFPSHIVAAVAQHDTPTQRADRGFDLTVLAHVADRLTLSQGEGTVLLEDLCLDPGFLEEPGVRERLPHWAAAVRTSGAIEPRSGGLG